MIDKEFHFSAAGVVATALWAGCVAVWAIAWALDLRYLAGGAIILSVAAGTMSARASLLQHHEEMKSALVVTGRTGSVTPIGR